MDYFEIHFIQNFKNISLIILNYYLFMNGTLKEKFNLLLNTLHSEENYPILNSILDNEESNSIRDSLINTYNNKVNECSIILNEVKSLSENDRIERLNNNEIVINSTPKFGREEEFNKKKNEFYKCYDKFLKLNDIHTNNNNFLNQFVQKSYEKCILSNCEKLIEKSEEDAKNCIRDCFKLNQINTFVMSNMVNDELLKFQNDIAKL